MAFDESLADAVQACLVAEPGIRQRKMFGGLCFLLNGNMCCGVLDSHLVVRVGKEAYAESLKLPGAKPFDFTGRPLTGIVYVALSDRTDMGEVADWVDRGLAFARTLPPK